jgi:hypothetical protein
MGLDAGRVLKRSVLCLYCREERLFTLRAIAENPQLKCSGCGSDVCISNNVYEPLLREVRNTLAAIDSTQLTSSFMGRRTSIAGGETQDGESLG